MYGSTTEKLLKSICLLVNSACMAIKVRYIEEVRV